MFAYTRMCLCCRTQQATNDLTCIPDGPACTHSNIHTRNQIGGLGDTAVLCNQQSASTQPHGDWFNCCKVGGWRLAGP